MPKGSLRARRALDVFKVDEHALRRLRTQINFCTAVLSDALMRLEHHVEFADVREIQLLPQPGQVMFILPDIRRQRLVGQPVGDHRQYRVPYYTLPPAGPPCGAFCTLCSRSADR